MFLGEYYYTLPESFPALSITSVYYVMFAFAIFLLARISDKYLKPFILLTADVIFLFSFSKFALISILVLAIGSYILGYLLSKYKNKYFIFAALVPFIACLLYFKYAGLLTGTSIIMPIGLSFYTFKIMAYLIDVYNSKIEANKNIIEYLNYVMFFPTITAGPINDYSSFIEQLRNPKELEYKQFKNGFVLMLLGIFEKLVFCDYVAYVANVGLNSTEIGGVRLLVCVILYSFNIYLDFDACSNIAIGFSRALGFDLAPNFRSPYLATSLKDFWGRWHISLSTWLKKYIYIPLGGNRKGEVRKYINLIIVFAISGLWHGSTVNFLVWGILHAVIRIIEDQIERLTKYKNFPKAVKVLLTPVLIAVNFAIVTALWLVFRCQTMNEVMVIVQRILAGSSVPLGITKNEELWLLAILTIVVILDVLRNFFDMTAFLTNRFFVIRWAVYAVLIVVFLVFGVYGGSYAASDFIYQWF